MATASDNFNRADENPLSGGGNWVQMGTHVQIKLVTNQVTGASVAYCLQRWTTSTWASDQSSEMTMTNSPGDGVGCAVRCSASAVDLYSGQGWTAASQIKKWVTDLDTNLAQNTTAWGNTDVIKVDVTGTTITIFSISLAFTGTV